jgi:hypothetical protein
VLRLLAEHPLLWQRAGLLQTRLVDERLYRWNSPLHIPLCVPDCAVLFCQDILTLRQAFVAEHNVKVIDL